MYTVLLYSCSQYCDVAERQKLIDADTLIRLYSLTLFLDRVVRIRQLESGSVLENSKLPALF
jgi:hypothetical protein